MGEGGAAIFLKGGLSEGVSSQYCASQKGKGPRGMGLQLSIVQEEN